LLTETAARLTLVDKSGYDLTIQHRWWWGVVVGIPLGTSRWWWSRGFSPCPPTRRCGDGVGVG
jgi:hypothetical protein